MFTTPMTAQMFDLLNQVPGHEKISNFATAELNFESHWKKISCNHLSVCKRVKRRFFDGGTFISALPLFLQFMRSKMRYFHVQKLSNWIGCCVQSNEGPYIGFRDACLSISPSDETGDVKRSAGRCPQNTCVKRHSAAATQLPAIEIPQYSSLCAVPTSFQILFRWLSKTINSNHKFIFYSHVHFNSTCRSYRISSNNCPGNFLDLLSSTVADYHDV